MNNKGLIVALIIIILLGSVIYLTFPKNEGLIEPTGISTTDQLE